MLASSGAPGPGPAATTLTRAKNRLPSATAHLGALHTQWRRHAVNDVAFAGKKSASAAPATGTSTVHSNCRAAAFALRDDAVACEQQRWRRVPLEHGVGDASVGGEFGVVPCQWIGHMKSARPVESAAGGSLDGNRPESL
jgi:hypothetical protein